MYLILGCVKVSTVGVYSRPEPSLRLCLQYLDLTDCQLVDDANLCVIVSNCPQLAYLYLRRCTKVTGNDTTNKYFKTFNRYLFTMWSISQNYYKCINNIQLFNLIPKSSVVLVHHLSVLYNLHFAFFLISLVKIASSIIIIC